MLGFAAGVVIALCVAQPLIFFLHHLGLTARYAFSTSRTFPLGVESVWSRVFWGGVFGVALAWFGTRYPLGARYVGATTLFTAGVRTAADWFIVPMFFRHAWIGWGLDPILTPVIVNFVWAFFTALLLMAFTIFSGTWGAESPI